MELSLIRSFVDHLVKRRAEASVTRKRGLLLVSSGGLGDTMLFSLMVERFRTLLEDDEPVWIIVRHESIGLQFLFPDDVQLIPVHYRNFIRKPWYRWKTSNEVLALGPRIVICADHLRLPTVDDALAFASGAEERYALSPRSWPKHDAALQENRERYTRWIKPEPAMAHRLLRWWELANGLTTEMAEIPKVRFDPSRIPVVPPPSRPEIIIHPFSSDFDREADPQIFLDIADAFSEDFQIVMTAAPRDLKRAPRHQPLADHPGVEVDTSDLKTKATRIKAASLVVSVDTSIMHLAVGVGAPTLCLASAAHVVDSVPYDSRMTPDNVTFMVPEIDCAGCLGRCIYPLENGRYRCLGQITTANVLPKVREMLAAQQRPD